MKAFPKGRGTESNNMRPASATLSLEPLTLRGQQIAGINTDYASLRSLGCQGALHQSRGY